MRKSSLTRVRLSCPPSIPKRTALSERVAAEARARAAELRLHNPGWGRSILDDAAHEADQLEVLARELDDERARAHSHAHSLWAELRRLALACAGSTK